MFTKYILPLLALAGLSYGIVFVVQARQVAPPSKPLISPPTRPNAARAIAGSGIIEARLENIPIGVPMPGVVMEVYVKVGNWVKKGDPLFRLDDRDLQADLKVRIAALDAAKAQLHKMENAPRAEDIPPAKASVEEAEAKLSDAESMMARSERLFSRQMVAGSDFDKDKFTFYAAKAALARAKAEYERLMAGSWKEDILVSRTAVEQAQSQVESVKIMIDRLMIRALTDGQVLQVDVRPGQFALNNWKQALIYLGDLKTLHVRVDIDENDLPLFDRDAEAVATLKGRPAIRFPLKWFKIEPYVIPKKSLTGDNSERVDTRVLQVVYALPDPHPDYLHVGQQMDVYIRAAAPPDGLSLDSAASIKLPFDEAPAPANPPPDSAPTPAATK